MYFSVKNNLNTVFGWLLFFFCCLTASVGFAQTTTVYQVQIGAYKNPPALLKNLDAQQISQEKTDKDVYRIYFGNYASMKAARHAADSLKHVGFEGAFPIERQINAAQLPTSSVVEDISVVSPLPDNPPVETGNLTWVVQVENSKVQMPLNKMQGLLPYGGIYQTQKSGAYQTYVGTFESEEAAKSAANNIINAGYAAASAQKTDMTPLQKLLISTPIETVPISSTPQKESLPIYDSGTSTLPVVLPVPSSTLPTDSKPLPPVASTQPKSQPTGVGNQITFSTSLEDLAAIFKSYNEGEIDTFLLQDGQLLPYNDKEISFFCEVRVPNTMYSKPLALYSNDGGKFWRETLPESDFGAPIQQVIPSGTQGAYLITMGSIEGAGEISLYHTSNKGQSWKKISSLPKAEHFYSFQSIQAKDAKNLTAILYTYEDSKPYQVLESKDGGATWTAKGFLTEKQLIAAKYAANPLPKSITAKDKKYIFNLSDNDLAYHISRKKADGKDKAKEIAQIPKYYKISAYGILPIK